MTATEHAAQKALVLAAERLSPDRTERHNAYALKPCPKCGTPGGLVWCPKCHGGEAA